MALSFNYACLPGKKGTNHKCPTIKLNFKGKSTYSTNVIALLDSGADISVIPKDLAEFLNLDLSGEESTSHGINGEIKTKKSKVQVKLKKNHEDYSFVIPVEVALEGDPPIILGRNGFFEYFKIIIDEKNKKIILKKNQTRFQAPSL